MDLDIQVSKLKLLKANHTSQIYSLESDIARRYPREIAAAKGQIEALKTDIEAAKTASGAGQRPFCYGDQRQGVHRTQGSRCSHYRGL